MSQHNNIFDNAKVQVASMTSSAGAFSWWGLSMNDLSAIVAIVVGILNIIIIAPKAYAVVRGWGAAIVDRLRRKANE